MDARTRCAQRRPGSKPRRHRRLRPVRQLPAGHRSTKAGEPTPATQVTILLDLRRDGVRSTKAGEQTPATLPDPRNLYHVIDRSTKAGEQTPATPLGHALILGLLHVRSTKAGEQTPATRDIEIHHAIDAERLRSTKAGEQTPATHGRSARAVSATSITLNEGRGANPGDT